MMSSPSLLVFVHIWAGTIAILFGYGALFAAKGSRLHRASGTVFFLAMLAMAGIGAFRGWVMGQPMNIVAGTFTLYMVATAWLTVWRKEGQTGFLEVGAMLVALLVGSIDLTAGWRVASSAVPPADGVPAAAYFVFGSVALLGAAGDLRMLIRRGVRGGARILRHLWRMGFAMFVATASLFLGQQRIFPEELRGSPLMFVPVMVVVVLVAYWALRVRFGKAYRRTQPKSPPATATPLIGRQPV